MLAILCAPSLGNDVLPDSAATWNENGTFLYSQGKYGEALHAFNNALEFNSSSPQIWYNKGNALYSQGNYDEAIQVYDKVLELDPQYIHAWVAKGKALYYQKKYEEAIRALDEVIKLNPRDADAWSIKNRTLNALSLKDQAIKSFPEVPVTNQPPYLASLDPDHLSPQDAGTDVVWTASAFDLDGDPILYMFLLNGKPVTDWSIVNTWTWSTSEDDEGENQLDVRVRDGMHASPDDFDDKMSASFLINQLEVHSHSVFLGGSKKYSYVPGPAFTNSKPSYVPGIGAFPI